MEGFEDRGGIRFAGFAADPGVGDGVGGARSGFDLVKVDRLSDCRCALPAAESNDPVGLRLSDEGCEGGLGGFEGFVGLVDQPDRPDGKTRFGEVFGVFGGDELHPLRPALLPGLDDERLGEELGRLELLGRELLERDALEELRDPPDELRLPEE